MTYPGLDAEFSEYLRARAVPADIACSRPCVLERIKWRSRQGEKRQRQRQQEARAEERA